MKKLPYDQDTAFAPVGFLGSVPLMVAVNNDVPAKTLKEFVDLAKAKPGQVTFAYASTSQQVSSEMLASMAGIQMNPIPYKSGPAAMTDLIGGQVNMFTADFGVTRAAAQGRQDPRPGGHVDEALGRRARTADGQRGAGPEGLRADRLLRRVRAGRHAARRRSPS